MTLYKVFQAGSIFLQILDSAILLYCVLSWFRPNFSFYYWLQSFIRPFVTPFRRLSVWLMSRTRMPLDFSCWFAIIGLSIIERLWWRLYILLRSIA